MSEIILYKSNSCPACKEQMKILNKYPALKKKIKIHDVDKSGAPDYIKDSKGNYSIPTWVSIKRGIINPTEFIRNKNSFGVSDIQSLSKTGKNSINTDVFNTPNSWDSAVKDKWGANYLSSGTYGSDIPPDGDFSKLYSGSYAANNIRMVRPGGPEDAYNMMNYNCNLKSDVTVEPGLYSDSKGPFKFGNNKNYSKSYAKDSLLVYPYSGGTNTKLMVPEQLENPDFFINRNNYGKKKPKKVNKNPKSTKKVTKKPKKTPKEGSILVIKKNKVKVK